MIGFYDSIYRVKYTIIKAEEIKRARKYLYDLGVTDDHINNSSGLTLFTMTKKTNTTHIIFIFVEKKPRLRTIVHESMHATLHVFNTIDQTLNNMHCQEPAAYYIEFLTGNIFHHFGYKNI